jgi:hypothetical protein
MRINTGTSQLYTNQRAHSSTADRSGAASFSAALTTATAGMTKADTAGIEQTDFTSMTRKELFDWMNSKLKSGEMSFDDSSAFLGMTMKIPVDAGPGTMVPLDDQERVNFLQMAQDGIAGAMSRNDKVTIKMLQSAIQTMQRYESQIIGVNIRA